MYARQTGIRRDEGPDGPSEGVTRVDGAVTAGTRARGTVLALSRDALGRAVRVPCPDPGVEVAILVALAEQTRERVDVATHAQVLRSAVRAQLSVASGSAADGSTPADALLTELLDLVAECGLTLFRVDAHALVARRALIAGDEEAALSAVTTARTLLDEPALVDHAPTVREHRQNQQWSLRLVAATLTSLGMHELAVPLVDRARHLAEQGGDPVGVAHCDYERVRISASWGLRLQRAGRDGSAQVRHAARLAVWLTDDARTLLPADHRALLRAACVLHRHPPDAAAAEADRRVALFDAEALRGRACATLPDHLFCELARGRALHRAGHVEEAVETLEAVHRERPRGEPDLLLAVHRDLARAATVLTGNDPRGATAADALRAYTGQLEAELWSLRQARVLSLETRVAHERLRREHGEVRAQARTDPLTGLSNRRALDDVLARLRAGGADAVGGQASVAVLDVDGFKRINDRLSHARGDEVLRLVADTLTRALRADDVVARFGGDEFVVVLPGLGADQAARVLARTLAATSTTPIGDGTTVSLSAGVAEMFDDAGALDGAGRPEPARHPAEDVLVRADAAMYEAKRAGGGTVRRDRRVRSRAGRPAPPSDGRSPSVPDGRAAPDADGPAPRGVGVSGAGGAGGVGGAPDGVPYEGPVPRP